MSNANRIYLPDVIGGGYRDFWNFKGRYRVVKGSRASKKSVTAALWFIYNLMKYHEANLLVVRKIFRTLKDSCYTQLKWAIHRLGVDDYFICRESPLEITYKPTGQKIFFRGLDDSLKVTSITVDVGVLCWLWAEEAYEITSEAAFDTIDESIRGEVPEGLFKQATLTFNPWNEKHWLKKRFFDKADNDVLADSDRNMFERMRLNNPRRYQVAGLGDWGIVEGLVYENWEERAFDTAEITKRESVQSAFGLDFGYTNDPSALFCGLVDTKAREIYVFDEMYKKGLTNEMIYQEISRMGYSKENITADSAEPKSIAQLRALGLTRIHAAKKGRDSILNGIQLIQDYKIVIHPRCVNFLTEIGNYTWDKDKFDNQVNKPIDDFNHLLDAMRYAMERFGRRGSGIQFLT